MGRQKRHQDLDNIDAMKVVDDEVGVEPDPVDAAAAGPDGDVVAETRAAAVGAGVAPLVQPG